MYPYFRPADFLLVCAALLPFLVARSEAPSSDALAAAGNAAGVLGLSLLLVAAAISARFPDYDVWFGGLTKLWKIHHVLGATSFVLVMSHPLLLAFASAPVSIEAAGAVLFPTASAWSVWAGWLSFAAMATFLAPTFWFFGQPRYQRWKSLHALSALAVLLALAHAIHLAKDSARAVWLVYGALALLAFIYRKLVAPRIARSGYTITRVESVNRGVVELTLEPEGRLLDYRAGQFVYLTPLDGALASGWNEEHPYTLSSTPGEKVLRIAIKNAGDATRALQTVARGSRALVEGPYGDFFPAHKTDAPALWIAGGIGIAPFLSGARSLSAEDHANIHLIYCVQDDSRAHFIGELEAIAARIPRFKVIKHFFACEGALTAAFIASACGDFAAREIYMCGPPAFIVATRSELHARGVSGSRIHTEDFTWL
jgi:predicted ferric reductase